MYRKIFVQRKTNRIFVKTYPYERGEAEKFHNKIDNPIRNFPVDFVSLQKRRIYGTINSYGRRQ